MNRRSFFGRLAAFALTGPTLLRVLALSGAGTTAIAVEGCNGTTVANDIVSWTPALQSTVATFTVGGGPSQDSSLFPVPTPATQPFAAPSFVSAIFTQS
jgi:hypothetical protein